MTPLLKLDAVIIIKLSRVQVLFHFAPYYRQETFTIHIL